MTIGGEVNPEPKEPPVTKTGGAGWVSWLIDRAEKMTSVKAKGRIRSFWQSPIRVAADRATGAVSVTVTPDRTDVIVPFAEAGFSCRRVGAVVVLDFSPTEANP